MLAGAHVAGQFYDQRSAALQLQQLGPFLPPPVRRYLARRREQESLYDSFDPFGPELLWKDPRNFQIPLSALARTRFQRNRSLRAPFNVGVVELELVDGTKRRLILVRDQEPDAILELVRRFDPATVVTGTPNPLSHPKPMSTAGKRLYFELLAGFLIASGVFFGCAAWAGVVPNPAYWPLAAVNILLGGWCLVKAWKVAERQQTPEEACRTRKGT